MPGVRDIFDSLIKVSQLIDSRIDRLETQLREQRLQIILMQKRWDKAMAGRRNTVSDGVDDFEIAEVLEEDVVAPPLAKNSNPVRALPSADELFAGFERIIS